MDSAAPGVIVPTHRIDAGDSFPLLPTAGKKREKSLQRCTWKPLSPGIACADVAPFSREARIFMKQRKIIVTCAVTGAIHTPSMSPFLPISAREIEDAAVGAAEAGASIVHLHAREPGTGRPSQDPELFRAFVGNIRRRSRVVVNLTTGGAPNM